MKLYLFALVLFSCAVPSIRGRKYTLCHLLTASTFLILLSFLPSFAGNAADPGEVITPYPTITNLAVEWLIEGDDNLNSVVTVGYRRGGEDAWHKGSPLVRVPADNTGSRTRPCYRWENKHSGSIFDLKPDTEYEIRLRLSDPDGGKAEKVIRARTRPVPRPAPDSVVKKVNPGTFWDSLRTAQPGDILLLSPGYYDKWYSKSVIELSGEPGRPVVIRADRADKIIGSTFDDLSLEHCRHVIIDGLTVNGTVSLRFAEDVAVRYCTVNAKYGIVAKPQPGCRNCYIADNVVTYVMPWVAEGIGSSMVYGGPANVGEGIEITGPGNVICHNRVSGFRDCISTMEDLWVYDQICIDIYNNDISVGTDDGIEADFCMNNCRIMRNRITNCGMGLSSQPGLGGPVYFIRNVMYNIVMCPFKLERYSVGNLFLHNTVVKSGDGFYEHHGQNEYFRTVFKNNLTVGGIGGSRQGRYSSGTGLAVSLEGFNSTCEFDYNGVGTYNTPFAGLVGNKKFTDLSGLRALTGGKHSVQVDMNVFKEEVKFPYPAYPERKPADLRIKDSSAAVDAAVYIPNINDGCTGKAPDLGAYELDREIPLYGPRPEGVDEETMWNRTQR
ncbi:MAG TPA: right-handed parallel beta-helix repeat-containing protein [archaeon]|nr:right-handed parallel beta-helix repeat-containing protein [archaeon]